jgi:hypothetical protein
MVLGWLLPLVSPRATRRGVSDLVARGAGLAADFGPDFAPLAAAAAAGWGEAVLRSVMLLSPVGRANHQYGQLDRRRFDFDQTGLCERCFR